VRRQPARHAAGHVLDERRVREHESLAGPVVALVLVATPEVLELDRLYVRLQVVPSASTLAGVPDAF